jgi:PAS domain S-box-containing protein
LETTRQAQLELRDQSATIRHLDEVLTMSARMSAATGDPAWERRYRRFEPNLDAAIKQVRATAQEAQLHQAISQTDDANARLVALENRAFQCVHEDHRDLAQAILSSSEYQSQKERYGQGMEQIKSAITRRLQSIADQQRRASLIAILTTSLLGAALVGTWFRIAWLMRRHLQAQARAEQTLLEAHQFSEQITRNAQHGVIVYGRDLHYREWNPFMEQLTGVPASEVLGRHPLEAFPFLRESGVMELLEQALREETVSSLDFYFDVPKNGKSGWVTQINAPFRNEKGEIVGVIGTVNDITERRRRESEKVELEARARQLEKAESLGRMAGAIAHHFNNKLQSVLSVLDLMSGSPGPVAPARFLDLARKATLGAAEVSSLMLTYLGQADSLREPCLLAELCRDPLLRHTLPAAVTLVTDCPSPGPVIRADSDQIRKVLAALVTNAWEAMGDAGGRIRLSLCTCAAADIPLKHRYPVNWQPAGQEYACLELADSGCGIAEADFEKLFDPFFSTKFTGRGLGLPVALGLVQAHDGAITVESVLGQGSVFRIYLPVVTEAVRRLSEAEDLAPAPEGGGTILLVDDDAFLLESAGALLEGLGFVLLTANNGAEALKVFREHQDEIRCVITDLSMPNMDGWEVLVALRHLVPDLPVILASGYDKAKVLAPSHAERPTAFLGKPFSLQQLRDALGQALLTSPRPGN